MDPGMRKVQVQLTDNVFILFLRSTYFTKGIQWFILRKTIIFQGSREGQHPGCVRVCVCVCVWGGGGTHFPSYVGSGPASTVHPPKISGNSRSPKKYLKF